MYIRVKSSKLSPRKSVQIVKSVRTGKRVSQVILQHVGIAHDEKQLSELQELGRKLILEMEEREQPSLPGFSLLENEEAWERPVGDGERVSLRGMKNLEQVTEGPGEVVESLFSSLGFEAIFGVSSRGKGNTEVLKKCLACALANPSSKRGMSRWLEDEGGTDMSLNRIYRMMDALAKKTDRVREIVARETASLFETKASLLLFDVTTLYFESFEADALRVSGYSKDNRIQETQVVLALAVTPEGFPLWYDLFPGNTFEGHTLVPVLRRCMETFSPRQAVVVADRAMFTEENLHEVEKAGCSFVVGAKLRGLSRTMREKILDAGNYSPCPEVRLSSRRVREKRAALPVGTPSPSKTGEICSSPGVNNEPGRTPPTGNGFWPDCGKNCRGRRLFREKALSPTGGRTNTSPLKMQTDRTATSWTKRRSSGTAGGTAFTESSPTCPWKVPRKRRTSSPITGACGASKNPSG
nr:IS1634 family transposase [Aminiphilus circumscriptus]